MPHQPKKRASPIGVIPFHMNKTMSQSKFTYDPAAMTNIINSSRTIIKRYKVDKEQDLLPVTTLN